jgi:hypothetical protein
VKVRLVNEAVEVFTRRDNDWTKRRRFHSRFGGQFGDRKHWRGGLSRKIKVLAKFHGGGRELKAEQAYRRSDALDKRRKLMEAWAAYCEPKSSHNVFPIRKQE